MARGKGKKRALLAVALILGVLFLSWFSLPLWFPWVLKPLARKQGATYSSYERNGYSRFVLHDLLYTNQTTELRADRVESFAPGSWLARLTRRTNSEPLLRAENWRLRLSSSAKKSSAPVSPTATVKSTQALIQKLQGWLPNASLTNGTIELENQTVKLPELVWSQGNLRGRIEIPKQRQAASFEARLTNAAGPYQISVNSASLALESVTDLALDSGGMRIQSTNNWQGNKIDLEARFGSSGSLPESATLRATNVAVPGATLGLKGYKEVRAAVLVDWHNGGFEVHVTSDAEPIAAETNWPPMKLQFEAAGDTNVATIRQAALSSPALTLELSQSAHLYFAGPLLREPAHLTVTADAAVQPWIRAQGKLSGSADLLPATGKFPQVQFGIAGTNIAYSNILSRQFELSGNLQWPWLEVSNLKAIFDDGSEAHLAGKFDLANKSFAAAQVEIKGPVANRWLPKGYSYDSAAVTGSVTGPIASLRHEGQIGVTRIIGPTLKPIDAQMKWSGEGLNFTSVQLDVRTDESSIALTGSVHGQSSSNAPAAPERFDLELSQFELKDRAGAQLALQQPCKITFQKGSQFEINDLQLSGQAGKARLDGSIDWPARGNLRISVRDLGSILVAGFVTNTLTPLNVRLLEASAGWTNGPLDFQTHLDVEVSGIGKSGTNSASASSPLALFEKSALQVDARGDAKGISISNLVATASTGTVAVARGFLPVTVQPGRQTGIVQVATNEPLDLNLQTQPNSIFWSHLAEWTGIVLKQPEFSVNLSGAWDAPAGQARLRAQQIEIKKVKTKLPAMEGLQADLVMDREQARLENCRVLVQGQPVVLTAQMPLGPRFWEGLTQKQGPNWENASARLRIDHASIAAFADFFPTLLAPQGNFNLDAEMIPGGAFRGEFSVNRARTRPLPSVGAVRDIDLKLKFVERELELQQGTANIGGATVITAGKADLRGTEWMKGIPPPFRFSLRGTNVPLSRQPESIVRSDLDLSVVKTNQNPAVISGEARIHDSYYLSDLTDLVPGKAASPRRRPPYFSIDVDPLGDWRLAVSVKGDRGFRVRSTLFNGQISLNLKLTGTLKEPIALGEARVDTGMVRFPFASLDVQQGFVTLTSQDPYEPQLLVTGASKRFGYDVKMDMTGPAEAPIIKFSSTPPLSSEQLVLMLTAGELPRGEFNLTPQQKAQTVALFLGKDLLAKLGFGDQTEERLTFTSGQEISEQGKPTYSLEYKLTDRWSLVGEYDRFNAYNAGLKWRVYSR
jgi:translocation and assembly module TamB